jgi:hypothetical protein
MAEESFEAVIQALDNVEVHDRLFQHVLVSQHEQPEQTQQAPPRSAIAGAAFVRHVGLHHTLNNSGGVHLKQGIDVQLCCLAVDVEGNHRTVLHDNVRKGTEFGHLKSGEGLMAMVTKDTGAEEA